MQDSISVHDLAVGQRAQITHLVGPAESLVRLGESDAAKTLASQRANVAAPEREWSDALLAYLSGSLDESALLGQVDQADPELSKSQPCEATLDGSDRYRQGLGRFTILQSLEIDQQDRLFYLLGQALDGLAEQIALFDQLGVFLRRSLLTVEQFGQRLGTHACQALVLRSPGQRLAGREMDQTEHQQRHEQQGHRGRRQAAGHPSEHDAQSPAAAGPKRQTRGPRLVRQ